MGRMYLEKLKNIRKATVKDRVGIEHNMNIRTVDVYLGLSEHSYSNYYM